MYDDSGDTLLGQLNPVEPESHWRLESASHVVEPPLLPLTRVVPSVQQYCTPLPPGILQVSVFSPLSGVSVPVQVKPQEFGSGQVIDGAFVQSLLPCHVTGRRRAPGLGQAGPEGALGQQTQGRSRREAGSR